MTSQSFTGDRTVLKLTHSLDIVHYVLVREEIYLEYGMRLARF